MGRHERSECGVKLNRVKIKNIPNKSHFSTILSAWIELIEKSSGLSGDSAAIAFREVTNSSLFSAAAIKSGFFSLVECKTKKRRGDKDQNPYTGRTDLDLWINKTHYKIEAKLVRVPLNKPSFDRIKQFMIKSSADGKASLNEQAKRIDLVFVVPILTEKNKTNNTIENKRKLISDIDDMIDADFCAYSLNSLCEYEAQGQKKNATGIVVLGKFVSA